MKRLFKSILHMKTSAWLVFILSLAAGCLMAFAACVLLFSAGPACVGNFEQYRLAQALGEAPAGMLLLGGLGALILEFQ